MVVHRILAFSFFLCIFGSEITACLCEYVQLTFTNMYLSTFSCIKNFFLIEKNGFIEAVKGGFDMSGRGKWAF